MAIHYYEYKIVYSFVHMFDMIKLVTFEPPSNDGQSLNSLPLYCIQNT